jgi:hypothetical protein
MLPLLRTPPLQLLLRTLLLLPPVLRVRPLLPHLARMRLLEL